MATSYFDLFIELAKILIICTIIISILVWINTSILYVLFFDSSKYTLEKFGDIVSPIINALTIGEITLIATWYIFS